MKKELLDILVCPACQNTPLKLFVEKENSSEILEGKLDCYRCKKAFKIQAGIPDLLDKLSITICKEITGNLELYEKERKYFNEEWLLSLPGGFRPKGERIEINTEDALKRLKLTGKEVILEIGAGVTWLSSRIVKSYGCNMVATDILQEKFIGLQSAEVYMNKYGLYYERVLCQMEKLPFVDNVFDLVISYASIHHSEDIFKTFKEASRVLKVGGKLILLHEGVSGVFRNNRVIGYDYEKENPYGWNEHTYWASTYFRIAKKCCLKPSAFWPRFLLDLERLDKENFANMKFGALAKYLVPLYKFSNIKRFLDKKIPLMFALILLGIPLNMIAVKIDHKNESS